MPSETTRQRIIAKVQSLSPSEVRHFLRTACETNFEPNLPLEVFEAFLAKCSPEDIQLLRDRLTERGSTQGLARMDAILNNDPNKW